MTSQTPSLELPDVFAPRLLPEIIGFFFGFRLFIVVLAVRLFGQDAQAGAATGLALSYALFGIVAFHSFGSAPRTLMSMLRVPCIRWVALFIGFGGMSLLWTGAASLYAAVAFWVAMAMDAAMIVLLLRTGPVDVVVNSVMKGNIWGTVVIACMAWAMPLQSDMRLGDEELLGPNQIAPACAFGVFFAQYLMRRKDGRWGIHALLLAVTLLRTLSKTTILAFVAGEVYLLLRDRTLGRKAKWQLTLASASIVAAFSGLLARYFEIYTHAGNQAETLTGRLAIWAYILAEAIQQPWIGHGFHSMWKVIPPFGPDRFEARHAQNELLQQFYAYGVVGIFMLIGIYGSVWRNLRSCQDNSTRTLFLGVLVFVLVRGLADTEAFDLTLPMWTIVMIGCLIEKGRSRTESIPLEAAA